MANNESPETVVDELTAGIEPMSYSAVVGVLATRPQPSAPLRTKTIEEDPFIEITWRDLSRKGTGAEVPSLHTRLESLRFRAGEIAVGSAIPVPTSQEVKCGVLATTGLNNSEIGSAFYLSEDTVKTHLGRFFARYAITDRSAIARKMLVGGFFHITKYCEELKLSPAEWEIVEFTTLGMNNKEIAEQLAISPLTVKSHFARIARSNNFMGSREQLALNALLSGQIDYRIRQT